MIRSVSFGFCTVGFGRARYLFYFRFYEHPLSKDVRVNPY